MVIVEPRNPVYWLAKKMIPVVNRLFLGNVRGLEHVPSRGPFILASNHVSVPDGWLLANAVIAKTGQSIWFIARDDFWTTQWWTRAVALLLPAILIDWRKPWGVIDRAANIARSGGIIGIFPEGTRNTHPDELMLGKTGAARIAIRSGAPIIPVGYRGPEITRFRDILRNFVFSRRVATLTFGAPIVFPKSDGRMSQEELFRATDTIMKAIAAVSGKRARLHN